MPSSSVNKFHWYDGGFYDRIIAPNQRPLFNQILNLLKPGSDVIDVGCGTGYFSFLASEHCKSVLGIDLSSRNIEQAKKNLLKNQVENLTFENAYLHDILAKGNKHFNYAILTYVIHEVNEKERIPLLKEIASVADTIIIGDYRIPRTNDAAGSLVKLVEFVAGSKHYRNFKSYEANGGIPYLAEQAGLSISHEIVNHINQIAVLSKLSPK